MAFQTPFSFGGYKIEWLQIFLYFIIILVKSWPMSAFQILENHVWSWVMSHGSFLKNLDLLLTYDSHIYDTHILWFTILRQFFRPQNFSESAHANFQISIFSKMRGRNIFRPHIRIQNKILHQMIWIHMGLSVIRPRKGVFFWNGSFTPTQSTWVAPRVL